MKNKKLIAGMAILSLCTSVLGGCGNQNSGATTETPASGTPAEETKDAVSENVTPEEETGEAKNAASNWVWAEIKENVTADMVTNPKDDFHLYVNKDWILNNSIPEGYRNYSNYRARQMDVNAAFQALLTDDSLTSDLAKEVQAMFNTILDWDARNELGYAPLTADLERIENIASLEDLYASMTADDFSGSPLFSYYVYNDLEYADQYSFNMGQDSLLLGDSAEYTELTENGQVQYDSILAVLEYMLPNLDMSKEDAKTMLDNAIEFEAKLAETAYTYEDMYADDYIDKVFNKMTVDEICALCPDYPMMDVLRSLGMDKQEVILVENPAYISALDDIVTEDNVEAIKNLYMVQTIYASYSYLDEKTYRDCTQLVNEIKGVTGTLSDEEMAANAIKKIMPIQCQQLYVEVYGSEELKQLVTDTCRQVIEAYEEMLRENDYLSQDTIEMAVEKLNAITINSLYPDQWPDVSDCDYTGMNYYEAVCEFGRFYIRRNLSKAGTEVDKEMWIDIDTGMTILECNAFYEPSNNSINMIFGMMGEPFYSEDMSVEGIYASLGAFWIGHEISHAFDSSGSMYDKDGNYCDWWTEEDRAAFDARIAKADEYLSSIEISDEYTVNGVFVDTEMVADITGLQCALKMAEKIDGFDYAEFFRVYGAMNVSIATREREISQLLTDVHPLDYLRTNVPVQQFEEFYKAFDVKEGDGMYLAPEDRIIVW